MRKVLDILFETVRIATFLPRSEKHHGISEAGHDDLTWRLSVASRQQAIH